MNDDDLTAGLEAWAAATDPAATPITPAEVQAVDGTATTPDRSRRWLAVAAAVLVVLSLAGAVAVTRDTDDPADELARAPDPGTATTSRPSPFVPLQLVIVNAVGPDRILGWSVVDCPTGATCVGAPTLAAESEPTTSLVVDRDQPLGTIVRFRATATPCVGGGCAIGGQTSPASGPSECAAPPLTTGGPTRLVATVTLEEDDTLTCTVEEVAVLPDLDVPPAFSLREPAAPDAGTCGAGAVDAGQLAGPSDRVAAEDAFGCFAAAVGGDELVELVTSEITANDNVRRSWWRALPAPVDGYPIEVFRGPIDSGPWTRARCAGVDPPGGATPSTLTGCTEEEALGLDAPPISDEAAPGSATPATGGVDVVLDVDSLPLFRELGTRRWTISIGGSPVASGPLTEIGGLDNAYVDGGIPDRLLIGDDLAVEVGEALVVTLDDHECAGTGDCRADGMGPRPGVAPSGSCRAEAPVDRTGPALVMTVRGASCTAAWAEVPALTVPPEWSLRPTATECATLDDGSRWATCLADVAGAGVGAAEWTVHGDGLRTTYLVHAGVVRVVRHLLGGDGPRWTVQTCTGIGGPEAAPEATGCGPEAGMVLTPP